MSAITHSPNGTATLLPYAMPRSLDDDGEAREQGRWCVAYSRDGWFLLDTQLDIIVRWSASEDDIRAAQLRMVAS